MIIRLLTQDDVAQHDKITSQAFSYSCTIGDPASVLPCEKVLGAFDDDNKTLFADLEIHEKKCNYDGGILTCAAIGGVAAKPEHRGKGAVQALFRHVFDAGDYDISVLYPFSEAYYRKLGYERVGNALCATVPFSELSAIERNQDVRLYEGDDTERLLEIYNRCARNENLSFVRETAEAFSAEPYFSKRYTYIWKNSAYATLSVDREKSTVYVHELRFDSCASMLGVLGFLRNFESNQKSVCFEKIPEASPLLFFLQDLKKCDVRLYNAGSARVLRAESVLKAHQYPPGEGAFTVRIGDEAFRVAYADGGVTVGRDSRYEPDVIMDVNTASKVLLCGVGNAAYMPGLVLQNPDTVFPKLFPPKPGFFTDAF